MPNDLFKKIFRAAFPHKNPILVKKEYHLPETLSWTIRLTPEGWFVATSDELPGLVTQARSQQELIEMTNDAVLTYFDVPKKEATMVYNQMNLGNHVVLYGQISDRWDEDLPKEDKEYKAWLLSAPPLLA
ncbi:MAG: hypothetical protein WCT54_00295 [Patescibacteria group bacterium]